MRRSAPRVDLTGTTVLVTGATPGSLGAETVRILRLWGADVTATSRSGAVGEALDLTDPTSVETFATRYAEKHPSLDVLINNAGVHLDLMSSWKEPHLLADGHEVHWRTNYLGTMHLTHRLLPLLAAHGRVVNVVSQLHARGRNADLFARMTTYRSWDAYGLSKLALLHATRSLNSLGVTAVSVHPGAVYTDIASKGLSEHRFVGAIRGALAPIERRVLLSPEQGAQTSVLLASTPDLEGGGYWVGCRPVEPSADSQDAAVSARLWEQTQAWIRAL